MLIARFEGDVAELTEAYDRAHAVIMSHGGAVPSGELRHHCATSGDALYIIVVWESEDHIRTRWSSSQLKEVLVSAGLPPPEAADLTILRLRPPNPRCRSCRHGRRLALGAGGSRPLRHGLPH